MDEAVAGHATFIEVEYDEDGFLCVTDNGRGIPVDPHPKFPDKSALEVILCTLHAGGKFDSKVYETSGGLHGVGVSVVNALSELLEVEVARGQQLYRQDFSRGIPQGPLRSLGKVQNRRGTRVRFKPDHQIFGEGVHFDPRRLFKMARSKAYLFGGVEIRWKCAEALLAAIPEIPANATFRFPGGLKDYLAKEIEGKELVAEQIFAGKIAKPGGHGSIEWAIVWFGNDDGFVSSYCNTIPTGEGGTHESGLRIAVLRGLKDHAERVGQVKRASLLTTDDVMVACGAMLSVFIREPEFVGQTKDKLSTLEASRIVEAAIRDGFDHWLAASPQIATMLSILPSSAPRSACADGPKKNRRENPRHGGCVFRESSPIARIRRRRAPSSSSSRATAPAAPPNRPATARPRPCCPCAARSSTSPMPGATSSLPISSLPISSRRSVAAWPRITAEDDLRYEKVIIMTDADVDGAHIASLLITFFYRQTPRLIEEGHLYLAVPPLYRLTHGGKTVYAVDDADKERLLKSAFKSNAKVEIGRFKGLGEMMPAQLKETTMDPGKRTLLKVRVLHEDREDTSDSVERLMGNKPELRFAFIQERASFARELIDV